MGMFDYVRCQYPLPGNPSPTVQGADFQTKDLDCLLDLYTIERDGALKDKNGQLVNITAELHIYCSNVVASGPGTYTANGEDQEWGDYTFTFVDGIARSVTINDVGRRPALKSSDHWDHRTPGEIAEQSAIAERAEEAINQQPSICLWWGSMDNKEGVMVDVVAREGEQIVVRHDGNLEIIASWQAGSTVFASIEDGRRWRKIRQDAWQRGRALYEAHVRI